MDTKNAVVALSALAQQSRLDVFRMLVERGPLGATPSEIIESLAIAPSTLSFHLKELAHSGLIHTEQRGRSIRYRADIAAMRELVDYLTQNCCAGNPSLCEPLRESSCAANPVKSRVVNSANKKLEPGKTDIAARRARK
ncbi:MAG: metalloregulator ArsR/SmtB family transcription factor [Dokdonella sp.]